MLELVYWWLYLVQIVGDSAGLLAFWFLFMVKYGPGIQPGHVVFLCCAVIPLVFILMRSACLFGSLLYCRFHLPHSIGCSNVCLLDMHSLPVLIGVCS